MNMNQLINQILAIAQRTILHRLVNWGVNKGIDTAAQLGRRGNAPPPQGVQNQQKQAREAAKGARQAAQITRRLR